MVDGMFPTIFYNPLPLDNVKPDFMLMSAEFRDFYIQWVGWNYLLYDWLYNDVTLALNALHQGGP